MDNEITCFKAYDIRGRIPDQLNTDVAYRVAKAMAEFLDAKRIVLGRDIRESSAELADAVVKLGADQILSALSPVERQISGSGVEAPAHIGHQGTALIIRMGAGMGYAVENPDDYGMKWYFKFFIVPVIPKPIQGTLF